MSRVQYDSPVRRRFKSVDESVEPPTPQPPTDEDETITISTSVARWIFLRSVAAISIVAFALLWTEISSLVGSAGILRAAGIYLCFTSEYIRYHGNR